MVAAGSHLSTQLGMPGGGSGRVDADPPTRGTVATDEQPRGAASAPTPGRRTGGAPPWSTRCTRARSPTATATAWATSPASPSRLDHLARLGIDVLWLSPVYRSPMDDNGYDISDYQDVDPLFGTLADLDALIAGCHERGIRLDHGPRRQPHLRRAPVVRRVPRPGSPKRDWYWWRPPRPGHEPGTPGAEPTNWESVFSGPAWQLDEAQRRVLPAPLLAASSPTSTGRTREVRRAVYAMMRWWVDRGVDGFRMDVINLISQGPARCPTARSRRAAATGRPSPRSRTAHGSRSSSPR